MFSIN